MARDWLAFDPDAPRRSPAHARLHAAFELAYSAVDLIAATCFIVGSVMFFSEDWMRPGTWLFLIGSLCFAAKPLLRFAREYAFWRMGRTDILAERFEND